MKLTTALILIASIHVCASGHAQRVTLSVKDAPLKTVFFELNKQTGYNFIYNDEALVASKKVSIDVKDAPLDEVLSLCFKNQPLNYVIQNNTIVIKRSELVPTQDNIVIIPPIDIHGRVLNEDGEPVDGAAVKVKGTNIGTSTNSNGEFSLKGISENAILVFSGVNIETTEIRVNGKNDLAVSVKNKVTNLQDVVINKGYYTERKRLSTGDVSTVTAKEISEQPVSDPILALEGRVPGMQISQASGIPGAAYTIFIRGQNSILNGNTPLFIIDGVPVLGTSLTSPVIGGGAVGRPNSPISPNVTQGSGLSPFNNLNPDDIENIEVLKDADATSIYGSRGANGVVLITTKKGKAGQTRVNVNVNSGLGSVTRTLPLLDLQQYLMVRHEAFLNDGKLPGTNDYDVNGTWDTTHYTDWQKLLIGNTAHFTNTNLSLSGGNMNTQFVLGGAFSNQTTVFPGNYNDQKISGDININHLSNDRKFHTFFSTQYLKDNSLLPQTDYTSLIRMAPDAPSPYDAMGNINFANGTFTNNPFINTIVSAQAKTDNLLSSLELEYKLFPGLIVKSQFGYTHMQMNQSNQTPATYYYGPPVANNRTNSIAISNFDTWILEPQLSYSRQISKGILQTLIGGTIQRNTYNTIAEQATGFSSDLLISNIGNASTIKVQGNTIGDYRYVSLFGRLNYNWNDKYLINGTIRRDGSSRFGPNEQFGNFGAVGAAWIFSKEKLFERKFAFLSLGKLRISYGTSGNDQISDYQYLSTYASSGNYQNTSGLAPNRIGNPYYQWEVDKQLEGGIELGILGNRIYAEADYYRKRSGNQLTPQPLPSQVGIGSIQANLPALVQNTGLELQLNTVNIESGKFKWRTIFNVSFPRNKLVSFPGLQYTAYANSYVVGLPLSIRNVYQFRGVNPQNGLNTFLDVNNDGQLTSADYIPVFVGQHYYGGFGNTFGYANLELDIFFTFVNQTASNIFSNILAVGYQTNQNAPTYFLNAWQKPGDVTNIAKYTTTAGPSGTASYVQANTFDISNASYLRLKNISLSYKFPNRWQQTLNMQNANLYMQAQNLFTITNFLGFDPETGGLGLPPLRMISLGFRTSF